jgi:signal transduction histidine kinase
MTARAGAVRRRKLTVAGRPEADGEELFDRLVHDLRNPLGVITYFAEAIPSAAKAERDELCERLRVNAQRALHVLEEFSLLADLRQARSRPLPQTWDVSELVEEIAGEIELMERRPGQIRRRIAVRTPLCLPRPQVVCALRAVLREAVRATPPDLGVELAVEAAAAQVLFRITVPARHDEELGTANMPVAGIELELAQRVAALHGGECTVAQHPDSDAIILALPIRSA